MNYTLHECLYYFDGPMLWTMNDAHGAMWAGVFIKDSIALICPTNPSLVDNIINNTLPVRALFETSVLQKGEFIWTSHETGTFTFHKSVREEDNTQNLPTPGIFLNPEAKQ